MSQCLFNFLLAVEVMDWYNCAVSRERLIQAMSYTLQLPPAVVSDAKVYASSCGTTLSHLVKMYIIELSTRKPEMKKRKLGIADGECRIPTKEEDCAMDEEIATIFGGAANEVFA